MFQYANIVQTSSVSKGEGVCSIYRFEHGGRWILLIPPGVYKCENVCVLGALWIHYNLNDKLIWLFCFYEGQIINISINLFCICRTATIV